jgi:hypothetical protein
MKIEKNKIFYIYIALYISLIFGFFLNEDFALGTIRDYLLHIDKSKILDEDIFGVFLNYDDLVLPHSPIYLLYFLSINNLFGDFFARLINLHFILLIPLFTYLSLNLRFDLKKNILIGLLPAIFFISPYFRSGSIWVDDNVLTLVFLTISIYFFLKYENSKNKDLSFIFFNTLFLALAAYFRPINFIFGFYFFISYFLHLKFSKKFYFYILFNIILSLPAFYYTIILDINDWFRPWLFRTNNITTLSLTISLILFYSLPFIFCNINQLKKIIYNKIIFLVSLIYLFLVAINFNYELPYSGGIFFKFSEIFFSNNYFFLIISTLGFYFFLLIFKEFSLKKNLILDITLFFLLVLLEIDGVIYHESYDPLFYIVSFLLIKNNFYKKTINNLSFKNLGLFFLFCFTFFMVTILKSYSQKDVYREIFNTTQLINIEKNINL